METLTQDKAVWQIAEEGTPEGFLMMLKEYPLDPTWEAYGDFGHLVNAQSYHPDHRPEWQVKQDAGVWSYSGNFLHISWLIKMEISDPDMIKKISEAIALNKQTAEYKKARADKFNCHKFTIMYYLNLGEMKKVTLINDKWWIEGETEVYLPLDYTEDEYSKAYNQASDILSKCNRKAKIKDNGTLELNPHEVHWIGDEWADIVRDFQTKVDPLSLTRWSQVMRIGEKPEGKEWIKYTFKSSGRVILYKWDTYGNSYYNVTDPFRNNTN